MTTLQMPFLMLVYFQLPPAASQTGILLQMLLILEYSSICFQPNLLDVHALHLHPLLYGFKFFTQINKIYVVFFLLFFFCCKLQCYSHLLFSFLAENFEPFFRMLIFCSWSDRHQRLIPFFLHDSICWLSSYHYLCNACSGLNWAIWYEYFNSSNNQNVLLILLHHKLSMLIWTHLSPHILLHSNLEIWECSTSNLTFYEINWSHLISLLAIWTFFTILLIVDEILQWSHFIAHMEIGKFISSLLVVHEAWD